MSELSIEQKSQEIRNETQAYANTRGRVANVIDDINETKANKQDLQALANEVIANWEKLEGKLLETDLYNYSDSQTALMLAQNTFSYFKNISSSVNYTLPSAANNIFKTVCISNNTNDIHLVNVLTTSGSFYNPTNSTVESSISIAPYQQIILKSININNTAEYFWVIIYTSSNARDLIKDKSINQENIVTTNMISGQNIIIGLVELIDNSMPKNIYLNGVFIPDSLFTINTNNQLIINLSSLGLTANTGDFLVVKFYKK